MSKDNGKELSIFDCSDQEFRRRIVEKINRLILKTSKHQRDLSELDSSLNDLQMEVDTIKRDLD